MAYGQNASNCDALKTLPKYVWVILITKWKTACQNKAFLLNLFLLKKNYNEFLFGIDEIIIYINKILF